MYFWDLKAHEAWITFGLGVELWQVCRFSLRLMDFAGDDDDDVQPGSKVPCGAENTTECCTTTYPDFACSSKRNVVCLFFSVGEIGSFESQLFWSS